MTLNGLRLIFIESFVICSKNINIRVPTLYDKDGVYISTCGSANQTAIF